MPGRTGSGGGGGGFDYVQDPEPAQPSEGEEWYDTGSDAAYVYTGSEWVEETIVNHDQLSGVTEGDHRSDSEVSNLSPVQSVNGNTGDVSGLATDTELSNHAGNSTAHHQKPTSTQNGSSGTSRYQVFSDIGQSEPSMYVFVTRVEYNADNSESAYDTSVSITYADGTTENISISSGANTSKVINPNKMVVEMSSSGNDGYVSNVWCDIDVKVGGPHSHPI